MPRTRTRSTTSSTTATTPSPKGRSTTTIPASGVGRARCTRRTSRRPRELLDAAGWKLPAGQDDPRSVRGRRRGGRNAAAASLQRAPPQGDRRGPAAADAQGRDRSCGGGRSRSGPDRTRPQPRLRADVRASALARSGDPRSGLEFQVGSARRLGLDRASRTPSSTRPSASCDRCPMSAPAARRRRRRRRSSWKTR